MINIKKENFTDVVMGILVFLMPIMSYVKIGGSTVNISYADIFLPIAFLSLFAKNGKIKGHMLNLYIKYLFVLLAIMLISSFGIILWDNFAESVKSFIVAVFKFLVCIGYVLVISRYISISNRKIDKIIDASVFTSLFGACLAYIGVFLYSFGVKNTFVYENTFRACGFFNDPNLFASYLFISLYLTIFAYIKNKNKFYLVVGMIQIGAILLTASKAAIISLVLCLFFGIFGLLKTKKHIVKLRLSSILFFTFLISAFILLVIKTDIFDKSFARFNTLSNIAENDITTGRLDLWSRSTTMIFKSPIWGIGLGQHNIAASELLNITSDFVFHNTFLSYSVELGLFGTAWYLYALYRIIIYQKMIQKGTRNYLLSGIMFSILFMALTLNLENFRNFWLFWGLHIYIASETLQGVKNEKTKEYN